MSSPPQSDLQREVESLRAGLAALEQTEAALRDHEMQLRAVLDQAHGFVAVMRPDGTLVDVNAAPLAAAGIERAEVLGLPFWETPWWRGRPELQARVRSDVRQAAAGETVAGGDWIFLAADGSERIADRSVIPVRDDAGEIALVLAEGRDVTEQRERQRDLEQTQQQLEARIAERTARLQISERRYQELAALSPVGIYRADVAGHCVYVNERCGEITGLPLKAALADGWLGAVHPEDRAEVGERWRAAIASASPYRSEHRFQRPDGQVRWVYSQTALEQDEAGRITGYVGTLTDITQLKVVEARLRSDEKLLRELIDLQERERQLVSHEIHDGLVQDVVGAKWLFEAAAARFASEHGDEALPPECRQILPLLEKAIGEGRRLIGELRPLIIEERGVLEGINYILAEIPPGEMTALFEHDVQFDRLESILEATVFRIVQEALTNVRRHSGASEAQIALAKKMAGFTWRTRDDGCGFDPDSVPNDRFGVRGIRERARLFGGHAEIDTTPGRGTRVRVELPVLEPRTDGDE